MLPETDMWLAAEISSQLGSGFEQCRSDYSSHSYVFCKWLPPETDVKSRKYPAFLLSPLFFGEFYKNKSDPVFQCIVLSALKIQTVCSFKSFVSTYYKSTPRYNL
jgi:hypothetical protein